MSGTGIFILIMAENRLYVFILIGAYFIAAHFLLLKAFIVPLFCDQCSDFVPSRGSVSEGSVLGVLDIFTLQT